MLALIALAIILVGLVLFAAWVDNGETSGHAWDSTGGGGGGADGGF